MLWLTWLSNFGHKIHKLEISGLWVMEARSWHNRFLMVSGTLKVVCLGAETGQNL